MIRWLSRAEFEAGERVNPYGPETPAELRSLRAPHERRTPLLLSGFPQLFGPVVRRLLAKQGQVWIPDAVMARFTSRRLALFWVLLLDACAAILGLGGSGVVSGIGLLAFLTLTLVGLPITVRALRRVRVAAWIDNRTGLVGVEDGQYPD